MTLNTLKLLAVLLLLPTMTNAKEEFSAIENLRSFDITISLNDLIDVDGTALYSGNLKFKYNPVLLIENKDRMLSPDRWIYQVEHSQNINQLDLKNSIQNRWEKIDFQSSQFTLKYKLFRALDERVDEQDPKIKKIYYKEAFTFGPSLLFDHVNFTKADGTLYGAGGWVKLPITVWFDEFFGVTNEGNPKEKRIDLEAAYYINDFNSKLNLGASYFYKASFIAFLSESFYGQFGIGYKSLQLHENKRKIDFAIRSPMVDIGLGYTF